MSVLLYLICFSNLCIFFLITLSHVVIHSIVSLISLILGFSIILFCLKFEFLAIVLLMIYVGAVSILFLFVSMMLNVNLLFNTQDFKHENYIFLLLIAKLLPYLFVIFSNCNFSTGGYYTNVWLGNYVSYSQSDVTILGVTLFHYLSLHTFLISIILFLGMVGSISICMSNKNL